MQDLLNTRRKNFFFNFFSYRISYLYFFQLTFQSVDTILQFKHLTHQRPNLPQLNGHQSSRVSGDNDPDEPPIFAAAMISESAFQRAILRSTRLRPTIAGLNPADVKIELGLSPSKYLRMQLI